MRSKKVKNKKVNMFNFNSTIMEKLSKTRWAVLMAVLLMTGLVYSCKDDDDDDDDGNGNGNGEQIDPNTIATNNLIAYFPFEALPEPGAAVENSNNTITFVRSVGNVTFPDGRRGNAFQGADNSYLEYDVDTVTTSFNSLTEFSLAGWIKTPATQSGAATIFRLDGGDPLMGHIALLQESQAAGDTVDLKLYFYHNDTTEWRGQDIRVHAAEFLNDRWFHLTAIYRASTSTMEFFANGTKIHTSERYSGPAADTTQVSGPLLGPLKISGASKIYFGAWPQQIGGTPETWMTYYRGMLDEFRIYNKALSDQEVEDLYDAEVSQLEEGEL
jgi:hypothetical protein